MWAPVRAAAALLAGAVPLSHPQFGQLPAGGEAPAVARDAGGDGEVPSAACVQRGRVGSHSPACEVQKSSAVAAPSTGVGGQRSVAAAAGDASGDSAPAARFVSIARRALATLPALSAVAHAVLGGPAAVVDADALGQRLAKLQPSLLAKLDAAIAAHFRGKPIIDLREEEAAANLRWVLAFALLCTTDAQRQRDVWAWISAANSVGLRPLVPRAGSLLTLCDAAEALFGESSPAVRAARAFLEGNDSRLAVSVVARLAMGRLVDSGGYRWLADTAQREARVSRLWDQLHRDVQTVMLARIEAGLVKPKVGAHVAPLAATAELQSAAEDAFAALKAAAPPGASALEVAARASLAVLATAEDFNMAAGVLRQSDGTCAPAARLSLDNWTTAELATLYALTAGSENSDQKLLYVQDRVRERLADVTCVDAPDTRDEPSPADKIAAFVARKVAAAAAGGAAAKDPDFKIPSPSYENLAWDLVNAYRRTPDKGEGPYATFVVADVTHDDVRLVQGLGGVVVGVLSRLRGYEGQSSASMIMAVRDLTTRLVWPEPEKLELLIVAVPKEGAEVVKELFNFVSSMSPDPEEDSFQKAPPAETACDSSSSLATVRNA